MQRFMDTLKTARRTTAGDPAVPGASDRYQQDVATSQAGVRNFGEQVADTLARINSATLQRINENRGFARTGDEVSGIARNAEADAFLARLRASGIMPNPYVDAAGQIATGVGTAMATRAPVPGPGGTVKPGIGGTGGGAIPWKGGYDPRTGAGQLYS
jgi:hypothetical protein